MNEWCAQRSRLGVVGMAYGGFNLGEEQGPDKFHEMLARLKQDPLELVPTATFLLNDAQARAAGVELDRHGVDAILAVITTFVPDSFIVELLKACDRPIFLWCVERELSCLSVVCGPLITATLYNRGCHYALVGADVGDLAAEQMLVRFARAALLRRMLSTLRVGYCGGRCPIMLSMGTDENALNRTLGATVVPLPAEEFAKAVTLVPDSEVEREWQAIKACVGTVTVKDADGLLASRYYLATRLLVDEHGLDALSLNCFPHLKARICLGIARLNDEGIAAACEGDLHSTILMHLLERLSGSPAFNGDWLRMYPETRDVLFSHCGGGALGLAPSAKDVCLCRSIETGDGLAVCYPTALRGPVTLVNMMHGPSGLRLSAMVGEAVETDLTYEGTPLRVHFGNDPRAILDRIARCGAGHHWNGTAGDIRPEFELLCEWIDVKWTEVT